MPMVDQSICARHSTARSRDIDGTGGCALSNEQSDAKVIPFPGRLPAVPIEHEPDAAAADFMPATVEYDGRTYELVALIRLLPFHCVREAYATAPRSGQEFWDEVVRRWPGTAAEVIAGAGQSD